MTITSRLSQAQTLVKAFEPFHGRAMPQAEGGFVIGYGHTTSARDGVVISRDEADDLLLYDLGQIGKLLDTWVYAPMSPNQRQALIAFGFDIGAHNLHRSTAMRRLNAGDYMGCAREIERWRMADLAGRGQVVDVLVRRRSAEKALFFKPPEGFLNTDTSRLRPRFDGERHGPTPAIGEAIGEAGDHADEPTSAAMTAAQNVSARLRALLPDPDLADIDQPQPDQASPDQAEPDQANSDQAEPDQPELDLTLPVSTPHGHDAPDLALQALARAPDQDVMTASLRIEPAPVDPRPPAPPVHVAPTPETDARIVPSEDDIQPPPPPFVPAGRSRVLPPVYANDISPTDLGEGDEEGGEIAPPRSSPPHRLSAEPPTPPQAATPARPPGQALAQSLRERFAPLKALLLTRGHLFLGLLGVLLFVLSILAILTGKPSVANLALGLVGVLCMTPSAYVLLGVSRT